MLTWVSEASSPEKGARTVSGGELRKTVMNLSEIVCCDVEGTMSGLRLVLVWYRMMTVSSTMPKYRVREVAIENGFRAIGEFSLSLQRHTTSACEYEPITGCVSEE